MARVSVNLDTRSSTLLDEKFDPDGSVPRTTTTDKDEAKTVETQPQNNATGMGANVPNVSQDATMQDPIMAQSDETRESKTTDFEISRTLKEEMQEPGAIIGRSAAVLIAKGETPRTTEQIDSIHNAVVNAIGARFDQVDLATHVRSMKWNFFLLSLDLPGRRSINFNTSWIPTDLISRTSWVSSWRLLSLLSFCAC